MEAIFNDRRGWLRRFFFWFFSPFNSRNELPTSFQNHFYKHYLIILNIAKKNFKIKKTTLNKFVKG